MTTEIINKDYTKQFKRLEELSSSNNFNSEYQNLREQLVIENLPLIDFCLQTYFSTYDIPKDDAKMYGIEGLVIAINNFDYHKGSNFASYAILSIKHNIQRFLKDMTGLSFQEDEKKVATSSISIYSNDPRFEMPMTEEDYEDIDVLEDEISIIVDEDFSEIADYHLLQKEIAKAIKTLPENERQVLKFRYGLDGNGAKTLTDVAKKLNVTTEVVRNTEQRALRHLRHPLHTRKLKPFYEEQPKNSNKIAPYIELKNEIYIYLIDLLKNKLSLSSISTFIKMKFNVEWTTEDLTKAITLLNDLATTVHELINHGTNIEDIIATLNESPLYPIIFDNKYYTWNPGFSENFISKIANDYEKIDLNQVDMKF